MALAVATHQGSEPMDCFWFVRLLGIIGVLFFMTEYTQRLQIVAGRLPLFVTLLKAFSSIHLAANSYFTGVWWGK